MGTMDGPLGGGLGWAGFDAVPHEVAIVDTDGTIVAVNEGWREFADRNHGSHPDYWVGKNYFAVCEGAEDPLAGEDIPAQLRAVAAGDRDQYHHEYPCHSPEEQRWYRLDARRFRHDGEPYLLVAHTNVTAEKLAERHADARAEQLETLVGVLSHDLRNPLTVIDGYTELLAADLEAGDERIETIRQAVTRITEITEATLEFTRSGTLAETEPLSVADLARTAWTTVGTADATLVVEGSRKLIGDRRLLLQLFENLFRNAVEHAGADCTVGVGPGETGFYVEDDGPGMPPELRQKALRADYSTSGTGGLGLAIVQAVASAHGADLTITEAAGGGTRFELTGFEQPPEPVEA